MGRGARTKGKSSGKKFIKKFRQSHETPQAVDPVLVDKYRVTRQADKKRELFNQLRTQTKNTKRARRESRESQRKVLRDRAPMKLVPKTKERLRKPDDTIIARDAPLEEGASTPLVDGEILGDEADDEFSAFFNASAASSRPKILITTGEKPSRRTRLFVKEVKWLFPNSIYRPRKDYTLKEITQFCINRGFSDLMVVTDRLQEPHNLIVSHLPQGPTCTFRVSNFLAHRQLDTPAERTAHYPELIFKNFDTRLGRRISRCLQVLFPATRDYDGRAVATFHNQRDYIFLRTHRYIFDSMKEVRIQEMGPRFTLRLLTLQSGTFDTKFGEFEWFRKKEHDQDRLEWYL